MLIKITNRINKQVRIRWSWFWRDSLIIRGIGVLGLVICYIREGLVLRFYSLGLRIVFRGLIHREILGIMVFLMAYSLKSIYLSCKIKNPLQNSNSHKAFKNKKNNYYAR